MISVLNISLDRINNHHLLAHPSTEDQMVNIRGSRMLGQETYLGASALAALALDFTLSFSFVLDKMSSSQKIPLRSNNNSFVRDKIQGFSMSAALVIC